LRLWQKKLDAGQEGLLGVEERARGMKRRREGGAGLVV